MWCLMKQMVSLHGVVLNKAEKSLHVVVLN